MNEHLQTLLSCEQGKPEVEIVTDYQLEWRPIGKCKQLITATRDGALLHSDELNVLSAASRKRFVAELCKCGCDQDQCEKDLLLIADEVAKSILAPSEKSDYMSAQLTSSDLLAQMPQDVKDNARDVLEKSDCILELVCEDLRRIGMVGEEWNAVLLYLLCVSRLLLKPLAALVQASSSAGKSYLIDLVASLIPDEAKVVASQMSAQSLFYLPTGFLSHKVVICGERSRRTDDDVSEQTRALREMLSGGALTKLVTISDPKGGFRTQHVVQPGPIAYLESTTLSQVFEEDRNRMMVVRLDESPEQTKRILECIAKAENRSKKAVIDRHHAIQRMLRRFEVVVPYAQRLAAAFPHDKLEARRTFPMLLACIKASALIHQYQRQQDADGRLIAISEDYAVAHTLMGASISQQLGGSLTKTSLKLLSYLQSKSLDPWSIGDLLALDDCPLGKSQLYSAKDELVDAKFIKVDNKKGNTEYFALTTTTRSAVGGTCIPTPEELFDDHHD